MAREEQVLKSLQHLEKADYRWILPLQENGHGSPAVWGERVFLNSSRRRVKPQGSLCKCTKSGEIEWTHSYPSQNHKTHRFNSFASSTPALDKVSMSTRFGDIPVGINSHRSQLI